MARKQLSNIQNTNSVVERSLEIMSEFCVIMDEITDGSCIGVFGWGGASKTTFCDIREPHFQ